MEVANLTQDFNMSLFEAAALGTLRANPEIKGMSDEEQHMARDCAVVDYIAVNETFEKLTTIQAMLSFEEWYKTSGWTYEKPVYYRADSYTVAVSMEAPSGTITVSAHITPLTNNHELAIKAAHSELTTALKAIFKRKEASNGQMPLPETVKTTGNKPKKDTEKGQFSTIRVKEYEGQTTFQIIPDKGRWKQFGIPLYKDVMKEAGIDPADYEEYGDYDLTGSYVAEMKDTGKPARITSLELE